MVAQNPHLRPTDRLIAELASLWGVRTGYRDVAGRWRESPHGSVLQVLGALTGEDLGTGDERRLRESLEARRACLRRRLTPPVLVAWDGALPSADARGAKSVLSLEGGGEAPQALEGETGFSGTGSKRLPFGYHRLRVESKGGTEEAMVISAPRRCWGGDATHQRWGLFAPLYALRSDRDWGAGDLADLESLLQLVSASGGSAVATLPLLAAYLDHPFEPAPYTPVSRLFWNEFYLAIEQIPEWTTCGAARAAWESSEIQAQVADLRSRPLVDYARLMTVKRRVVERLCQHFFREAGSERRAALESFVRERPEVLSYAEFRARTEGRGCDWRYWPEPERSIRAGTVSLGGLSEIGRYHLYSQWQMHEQLRRLAGSDACGGADHPQGQASGLFLDLPVGVHPGGFDVWRRRDLFVEGMSIGAPPDAFFTHGQHWDSPPPHPQHAREDGHSYWIDVLRHHLLFARLLRVDHIMSLHRLFWIPPGREPGEGVYVDYPADELYAVLCLESHRRQATVVGEDLGTVPSGVRSSMKRHGVLGTWVLQGAVKLRARVPLGAVPRHVVAALGTHDMFPLAGFLRGDDIQARVETGQLDGEAARRAGLARRRLTAGLALLFGSRPEEVQPAEILAGALAYLGASQAAFVLVNLGDLLLEAQPQNLPGTGAERDNWRRKLTAQGIEVERAITSAAKLLNRG